MAELMLFARSTIQQAGGVVTDSNGELPVSGSTVVAAATAPLHAEAQAIMQGAY